MKEYFISAQEAGGRLDKYLAKLLPGAGRGLLYKSLRKKNITLCGNRAEGSEILCTGDSVKIFFSDETINRFSREAAPALIRDNPLKKHIVYEDDELLVINKPAGMLSQKAEENDESLCEYIADYLGGGAGGFTPGISNRLDRNTSGIIVSGKTLPAQQALARVLKERSADKYYYAIAGGAPERETVFEGYLTKNAAANTVSISYDKKPDADYIKTVVTPVAVSGGYSLLKLKLVTGKTHQLRATLKELGLPIVGDAKYGLREQGIKRQMLHAYSISFPGDFEISSAAGRTFTAALPADFEYALRKHGLSYGF